MNRETIREKAEKWANEHQPFYEKTYEGDINMLTDFACELMEEPKIHESTTARIIAEKIFYSPATNGKAEQSITDGERLIEAYAKKHQPTALKTKQESKAETLPKGLINF